MKALSRFDLYELVRDATDVTGAQRVLLDTLAWRANAAENYSCYPSIQRLMVDTHYTKPILRRAAKALEEAGLIRRVPRTKRSTLWYLNVRKLQELAAARRELNMAEVRGREHDPFELAPMAWDEDTDTANPNDRAPLCENLQDALTIVRRIWPDHPSLRTEELLSRDLEECMRTAGSWQRCGDLLYFIQRDDAEATRKVAESRMLGRYLVNRFPYWLPDYADQLEPLPEEETQDAAHDF